MLQPDYLLGWVILSCQVCADACLMDYPMQKEAMMFKHILVPASGLPGDEEAFAAALMVAKPNAAHLQFLHVGLDETALALAMAGDGIGSAIHMQRDMIDRFEASAQAQVAKVRKAVITFCARSGIIMDADTASENILSAEFSVEVGDPVIWVSQYGRFADLVVTRRPVGERSSIGLTDTILTATGRPVLIAGRKATPSLSEVVLVAWKDRPEAARAVVAAMPFIEGARRVIIVSIEEDGAAPQASCEQLQRSLRWHNPAVEVLHVPSGERPAAEVMLETGTRLGASLLVMGGYSHSRLREIVFGGFTRYVLEQRELAFPVLAMH